MKMDTEFKSNYPFATIIVSDDKGAVLLSTVIILLLVTLIGVSGINTSSTDLQITRNYRIQKMNVALADAAVNRAKSLIAYGGASSLDSWVSNITDLYNGGLGSGYFKDGNAWEGAGGGTNTPVLNEINVPAVIADWEAGIAAINPTALPGEPDTEFVVFKNLNSPDGNSVVIARSRRDDGDVIIEAGFNEL